MILLFFEAGQLRFIFRLAVSCVPLNQIFHNIIYFHLENSPPSGKSFFFFFFGFKGQSTRIVSSPITFISSHRINRSSSRPRIPKNFKCPKIIIPNKSALVVSTSKSLTYPSLRPVRTWITSLFFISVILHRNVPKSPRPVLPSLVNKI